MNTSLRLPERARFTIPGPSPELLQNKGMAGGYAPLDSGAKVPAKNLNLNFAPAVTSYTGGGAASLDGVRTFSQPVPYLLAIDHPTDGLQFFDLVAGTDEESVPAIVRPDDYQASTNAKVWKLRTAALNTVATDPALSSVNGDLAGFASITVAPDSPFLGLDIISTVNAGDAPDGGLNILNFYSADQYGAALGVTADGTVYLQATRFSYGGAPLSLQSQTGDLVLCAGGGNLFLPGVPTGDPHVSGACYWHATTGALTRSSG